MMANKRPARLGKCNAQSMLEQELKISVKTLLLIFSFVLVFFIFAFLAKGPTYGVL